MIDRDCIFCKIAGGDIPSSTVYEDEQFRVLLDLSPATKGHALICLNSIMLIFLRLMKTY